MGVGCVWRDLTELIAAQGLEEGAGHCGYCKMLATAFIPCVHMRVCVHTCASVSEDHESRNRPLRVEEACLKEGSRTVTHMAPSDPLIDFSQGVLHIFPAPTPGCLPAE